ncbi:efflux RND transporter permease subunit [Marinicella rhabdoformis]|uniref:efflux RND transporter permease subunit n=1 Tax=Marinicella rhabdoformis TaxID=2580566 RepID=UPI0012AED2F6|nr:MMPL family transporter [Marinicella rhabdoformis]
MKSFFLYWALKRPKVVFWAVGLVTLITAALIPLIQIDTDPENMLPESQLDRVFHNQIKTKFQLHDMIVIGMVNEQGVFNPKSLANMTEVANKAANTAGVIAYDLMALSHVDNVSQTETGALKFEWLMKSSPENEMQAQWVATQVERLPLLKNTLVSEDGKAAAIYVPIERKDESHRIATEIQQTIDALSGDDVFHITGLPVAEDTFGYQMFVQMGISAPLAALMICIMMWWYFRNLKFIAAPMMVAMATCIMIMGVMIGMGYTVHIMSSMIPIFLMPIAVVDSIHIMSDFTEQYQKGKDKRDVVEQVMNHLFKPMLFTSVTSAVGFASLMLTPIPPVQVFGAFVASGIFLAFALTMLFVPAYLISLDEAALKNLQTRKSTGVGLKQWNLKKWGIFALNKRMSLLLFFVVLSGLSAWGVSKIQINDNPVRWFKADHPIRIADEVLNEHFAGTYDAYIVLQHSDPDLIAQVNASLLEVNDDAIKAAVTQYLAGDEPVTVQWQNLLAWADEAAFDAEDTDALDRVIDIVSEGLSQSGYFQNPEALTYIEQLQEALKQSGLVGKSNGLPEVVKTVYRELLTGTASDYRLPDSKAGVAQTLLQYQSSHRPQDLWHFVSTDYNQTVLWLQLTSGDNQDMSRVIDAVDAFVATQPLPENVSLQWAGKTYLNQVWQQEMVAGMAMSLASAFVVVFVMMVLLFRSVIFGVLAMLPLTITITFIYGLIGWLGKDYDMPIAVLSSLTLGLSVDFAIHFLQRARDLYAEHQDFGITMRLMFEEPATAISRNAVVIALGFTPLLLAPLMPYVTVGFVLALIMAVSASVTLLLLPAMLMFVKKWVFK